MVIFDPLKGEFGSHPKFLVRWRKNMEFLNKIGITTVSGFVGLALLAIGGFLFLAGIGVITIQQVTVKKGRLTWLIGLILAAVGLVLFYPEFSAPTVGSEEQIPVAETQPTAPVSSFDSSIKSEWNTMVFMVPENGLWLKDVGSYSATGSIDTIAWSEKSYAGDLELTLDIDSSQSFSAANIIIYGNGVSQASGNLIFTIASDLQAIQADSIYDDGTYLFSVLKPVNFGEQRHTVLISLLDRKASLYLDGEEVASAVLNESINTSGKIGLLKWGGIRAVTFSNLRIKGSETIK